MCCTIKLPQKYAIEVVWIYTVSICVCKFAAEGCRDYEAEGRLRWPAGNTYVDTEGRLSAWPQPTLHSHRTVGVLSTSTVPCNTVMWAATHLLATCAADKHTRPPTLASMLPYCTMANRWVEHISISASCQRMSRHQRVWSVLANRIQRVFAAPGIHGTTGW